MLTDSPVVGTGMEAKAAVDSGVCVVAKRGGVVERSASKMCIRDSLWAAGEAFLAVHTIIL